MSLTAEQQSYFSPVSVVNQGGKFPAIIVCEHASNFVPDIYGDLGLAEEELQSHIAWDPGAREVSDHLSRLLDSPLVRGEVSRLVYDCNRPPEASDAMPVKSETTVIKGNDKLGELQRQARIEQIYLPFSECLAAAISGMSNPSVLITIHSFTPVYHGMQRDVEIGILHDTDSRLADVMLLLANRHTDLIVRRNEPYGPQDGVMHTLREHGIANQLLNVMIEIRNDLIVTDQQSEAIAKMLHGLLLDALGKFESSSEWRGRAQ